MSVFHLGAFDPNKDYSGKYFFMFAFADDQGIPACHCTHKYLGAVSDAVLARAQKTVQRYFEANQNEFKKKQSWLFDVATMLGAADDLVPVMERDSYGGMMLKLKNELDEIVPDKFPHYRPHITVPKEHGKRALNMVPVAYELRSGDNVIQSWPMGDYKGSVKLMARHFSDRVDEEMKKKQALASEVKKEPKDDLAASGGAASGEGSANEIQSTDIPMPVAKTPEEMLQDPKLVLEQGVSGVESASGTQYDNPASGESDAGTVNDETVKMFRAPCVPLW